MTTAEKIPVMKIMWHKYVLSVREQQRKFGNQTPLNWETAKRKIRNQVDNLATGQVAEPAQ